MRLLLGSGGFTTPQRLKAWNDELRSFYGERRVLFISYALQDQEAYFRLLKQRFAASGVRFDPIHKAHNPRDLVRRAEALFIGGGNTFRLLQRLQRFRMMAEIRKRVRAGMPSGGASAGTNVHCPTIKTTNDMPIVEPDSLVALGLVPFQVNPHYFAGPLHYKEKGGLVPYGGETRDDRIREFHEENKTPVLGLWEGAAVRVEGRGAELILGPARLFRSGGKPVDLKPGADLTSLLRGIPIS